MTGYAKSWMKSRIKALDRLGAGLVTLNYLQNFPLLKVLDLKILTHIKGTGREKETLKQVEFSSVLSKAPIMTSFGHK